MSRSPTIVAAFSPARSIAALALAVAAVLAVTLPMGDAGRLPPALAWLSATLIVGLIPAALTAGTHVFRAGALLSAVVAGSAAQFALVNDVWFDTLDLSLSVTTALPWALVGVQGLVTAVALAAPGQTRGVLAIVRGLGLGRILIVAALLASLSVSSLQLLGATWLRPIVLQAAVITGLTILNIATFMAFAASLIRTAPQPVEATVSSACTRWAHLAPWALASFGFIVAALLAAFAFQGAPHVEDEVAYLVQAKMLLAGKLSAPAPPPEIATSFEFFLIPMSDGQWFSVMPVGWPAALAGGVAIGPYWLLNPLLAAVCILLLYRLVGLFAPRPVALACAAALALSPWHLITAGSLMSHTFSLALQLGGWLLLALACRHRSILIALASGALMGLLFLTRPLDGVTIGGLSGLAAIAMCWRSTRGWLCIFAYGAGCVAVGVLIFPYNMALTGNALEMPLTVYFDALWGPGANGIGFGPDMGPPGGWGGVDPLPGHSLMEAAANSQHNARDLNSELFGWGGAAAFSLLPITAHAMWGKWRRMDWLALAFVALTIIPAALYWYSGGFYVGARYWFMAFIPLIFLSVRGFPTLAARLPSVFTQRATQMSIVAVLIFSVASVCIHVSWRGVTRLHEFRQYHADYAALAADPALRGALVFVRTESEDEWGSALAFSGFAHPGGHTPIFALDRGQAQNDLVAAYFPGRPVHHLTGRDMKRR